jgi:hypothetical protein
LQEALAVTTGYMCPVAYVCCTGGTAKRRSQVVRWYVPDSTEGGRGRAQGLLLSSDDLCWRVPTSTWWSVGAVDSGSVVTASFCGSAGTRARDVTLEVSPSDSRQSGAVEGSAARGSIRCFCRAGCVRRARGQGVGVEGVVFGTHGCVVSYG